VLDTELLLTAYRRGIFPMAVDKTGRIGWFSPDPRAIIPLDEKFHIPHGLSRRLKKNPFTITVNQCFQQVIRECSIRDDGTWISDEIVVSYCELHRLGHAHSVEVWAGKQLAGGLYGVHIGGAFFGESMFHRKTDASKIALVSLVARLRKSGFSLLDTQWLTPHLATFGAIEIPREEYLQRLADAVSRRCKLD
jgi:leucyl/phenylalanyl-tRNA--protein transferase